MACFVYRLPSTASRSADARRCPPGIARGGRRSCGTHRPNASFRGSLGVGPRTPVKPVRFNEYRHEHGVEPFCRFVTEEVIPIAPSNYYVFKNKAGEPVCPDRCRPGAVDATI